jgi:hypothetical protein
MVLKRGDWPAFPAGMGLGWPMAFSLTCVESNLKMKFTLAVPVPDAVSVIFWQELSKSRSEATAGRGCSFIVGCFWLGKTGFDALLTQL